MHHEGEKVTLNKLKYKRFLYAFTNILFCFVFVEQSRVGNYVFYFPGAGLGAFVGCWGSHAWFGLGHHLSHDYHALNHGRITICIAVKVKVCQYKSIGDMQSQHKPLLLPVLRFWKEALWLSHWRVYVLPSNSQNSQQSQQSNSLTMLHNYSHNNGHLSSNCNHQTASTHSH